VLELLTANDLSGQQNPSAEKTEFALKSKNFLMTDCGLAAKITS